jgi:hypothetical protein
MVKAIIAAPGTRPQAVRDIEVEVRQRHMSCWIAVPQRYLRLSAFICGHIRF